MDKKDRIHCVYLLCSLGSDNLLKLAGTYRIKKEMSMNILDFMINDPTDTRGRPIKINSFFKKKGSEGFSDAIKRVQKDFGESNQQFSHEILEEVKLNSSEVIRFEKYFE